MRGSVGNESDIGSDSWEEFGMLECLREKCFVGFGGIHGPVASCVSGGIFDVFIRVDFGAGVRIGVKARLRYSSVMC